MNLLREIPGATRARETMVLSLMAALVLWPFFDDYLCSIMDPPVQPHAPSSGETTWDLRNMWH